METQNKIKSPLFWVGSVGAVYTAVVSAGVSAGVEMPWRIGAIGVGLSAVLVYCNGSNPSLTGRY